MKMARYAKTEIFNLARHRRPEAYRPIVERVGAGGLIQPDRKQMGLDDA